MLKFILNKISGTQNEREIKRLAPIVEEINGFEPKISQLSDAALKSKTDEFRDRLKKNSAPYLAELEDLESQFKEASPEQRDKIKAQIKSIRNNIYAEVLPEAFAVVREAGRRFINMRHFDVQLIGGMVLHEGKIAEMATGEGKTLVATLAAYLNALSGRGVHIVTVNDYLAKRDAEWMGPIYQALGLTVGVIQHDSTPQDRQAAYACDITYGTNNDFGFDYLRDNMVISKEEMVERAHHYAIVDEVDSILVDEARTPLIISGPAEESTEKYYIVDRIIPKLKGRLILEKDEIDAKYKGIDLSKGFDYIVDEKAHTAHLTDEGELKAASMLGIANMHDIENMDFRHHIIAALRAHNLFKLDRDYVVKDGQVIIVDEFTGRLMPGRRWSDGLHQAVEAKEGLKIERENQTLATITLQNYFKIYEKCAGMTGTAFTEANEFKEIYNLDVVVIPTNKTLIRTNFADSVFKTQNEKFNAVVEEIVEWNKLGRPLLVGTISIEKSERLSDMLKRRGVAHNVLNAKYHEMEAQIVAQAGRFKAVTIATNMAGRGTDILLGGNPDFIVKNLLKAKGIKPEDENYTAEFKKLLEIYKKESDDEHKKVVELGGLHVIGTERHEARRIDNQLRGRAGRQGDPGSSRFYVSFEDDLMRLFGQDRIIGLLDKLGWQEGLAIEHPWVSKSIETAQKRVENHNFEIRKQLLEYDNVMNKQRELIYSQRRMVMEGEDIKQIILDMISDTLDEAVNLYLPKEIEGRDIKGLGNWVNLKFGLNLSLENQSVSDDGLKEFLFQQITLAYDKKQEAVGAGQMRQLERMVMLQIIDAKWKDHLYAMDNLREGITLRAYGQRDPLVEYQHEAYEMFSQMVNNIKDETVEFIFRAQVMREEKLKGVFRSLPQEFIHQEAEVFDKTKISQTKAAQFSPEESPPKPQPVKAGPKVGRNDPCPCGAVGKDGKPIKYKKCHGR